MVSLHIEGMLSPCYLQELTSPRRISLLFPDRRVFLRYRNIILYRRKLNIDNTGELATHQLSIFIYNIKFIHKLSYKGQ